MALVKVVGPEPGAKSQEGKPAVRRVMTTRIHERRYTTVFKSRLMNCSGISCNGKALISKRTCKAGVSNSAKIALVTLIAYSDEQNIPDEELATQIRRELESGPLSRIWAVEKATILSESAGLLETKHLTA